MPEDVQRLLSAIDEFSKATSMPGGPSIAIQRHDPSWEAWKKICHAAALTPEKRREELTNTNCPVCHYWPCKCPS